MRLKIWRAGWLISGLSLVLFSGPALAQPANPWTPDDILLAESAGQFDISPDAQSAVWVKSQMNKEKGRRVSNLYLSSLVETREIQLTRGTDSNRSPRWSPDGTRIAFLTNRPVPQKKEDVAGSQIWLLDARGGEPWALTDFKRGVRDFAWKDSGFIIFLAEEDPTLLEQEIKERKDDSRPIDDPRQEAPVRAFLLEVEGKKVRRLTKNDDWIQRMEVSPNGRWLATVHERSLSFSFDHKVTPSLVLTDIESGDSRQVDPERRMMPGRLAWAKDSSGFYFSYEYSSHPFYFTATVTLLEFCEVPSGETVSVDLDWEKGLAGGVEPTDEGFVALLADGVRYRPSLYVRRGDSWTRSDIEGLHSANIWDLVLSPDGKTLVYQHSTASRPVQWFRSQRNGTRLGEPFQLTKLNPSYEKKPIPKSEVLSWTGALDEEVEGVVFYPITYEPGKRYPLMLSIHGGPTGTDFDAWSQSYGSPVVLLAQKGAFVLKVNYHGSGNYGLDWAESIGNGKYYELEPIDIMNGVETLIQRGWVDPDRLGTMGWSNGAILTTALITTHLDRFKVASAGAGDVEWISDWGNVMFGASFDNYYFGKAPYEDPDLYIRKSPYFKLPQVTTPTIIYTGTEDVNVPPSQSWSHFRVMQQATSTPVRFIVFPGEPHGLGQYVHQKRKLDEDLEWFDRYLFESLEPENPALKEGSPLEVALKIATGGRNGRLFGREVNGKLVPEVVTYEGKKMARFEVTRAQFAAFDAGYAFEPGTENYPANGVSFEQASNYAGWLSNLTGETFRLPSSEEFGGLYEKAAGNENTLDYWAGYKLNPDDAEALAGKVAELGAGSLLQEVGRFPGRGKDPVFDLGGNVSEWATGPGGEAVLLGGSADLPADQKSGKRQAGERYRGFRVVLTADKEK